MAAWVLVCVGTLFLGGEVLSKSLELDARLIRDGTVVCNSTDRAFCFPLLAQGPCQDSEWWVFEIRGDSLAPQCKALKCPPPTLYLPPRTICYTPEQVQKEICPHKEKPFFYNSLGAGECSCPCEKPVCTGPFSDIVKLNPCTVGAVPRTSVTVLTKPENIVVTKSGNLEARGRFLEDSSFEDK